MSLIPSFFGTGRTTNFTDPFCHEIDSETRMDWKETPEAHVFKVDLPGQKKDEVKLEIEGRVLQISGDKNHRLERSSNGRFLRRFRLPENAKVDQVKASMENGVLTVTFPKEVKKAIQITG